MKNHNLSEPEALFLGLMTAVKQDLEDSEYSIEQAAKELSYAYSTLGNFLNPTLGNASFIKPQFMQLLKMIKPHRTMDFLGRTFGFKCIPSTINLDIKNKSLEQLAKIGAESGDVYKKALMAYQDGSLSKKEHEQISKEIYEVIHAYHELQQMVDKDYHKNINKKRNETTTITS